MIGVKRPTFDSLPAACGFTVIRQCWACGRWSTERTNKRLLSRLSPVPPTLFRPFFSNFFSLSIDCLDQAGVVGTSVPGDAVTVDRV